MAETRWLNDTEQDAWRGLLTMYRLLMAQLERELQRDRGLSHTDYQVLVCLSEAPQQMMRMSDLAAATLLSRSRLSHQVSRMEATHLVRREDCPTDRRGAFAVLTNQGWEAIRAAAPDHVRGVREHLFDHLSEAQIHQLRALTGAVVSHLQDTETGGHYLPMEGRRLASAGG